MASTTNMTNSNRISVNRKRKNGNFPSIPLVENRFTIREELLNKLNRLVSKIIREDNKGNIDPLVIYSRLNSKSRDNLLHQEFSSFLNNLDKKGFDSYKFLKNLNMKVERNKSYYAVVLEGQQEKRTLYFTFDTSSIRKKRELNKDYVKKAKVLAFILYLKGNYNPF